MQTTKTVLSQTVRHEVRSELETVQDDWVRQITDSVVTALGGKIDRMYEKLDSFIGDIKDKRIVQELHSQEHQDISDRLETVEKRLGVSP